jgi:hypothetical protein
VVPRHVGTDLLGNSVLAQNWHDKAWHGQMSVAELLNDFRCDVPGCEAVAFADLATGLVLCASSGRKQPQEWFGRLCRGASELLDAEFARKASALLLGDGAQGARQAIQVADGEVRLFLRSEAEPNEALCCVCRPDVAVDLLVERARALLGHISTTEPLK